MKDSKVLKNIVLGFGSQIVIMVLGIVVPRIMLVSYGSDVNGLLSTITQIFSYMALLEAGIAQAARNALFKPITEKNRKDISYVSSIAQRYYRKITLYYAGGVAIVALLSPLVIKSKVSPIVIFLVVIIEGLSSVVTFYYLQTLTSILRVDGRHYINTSIEVVDRILSYAARIIMAANGVNIVLLQLVYFVITVAKVAFYKNYFKKHYGWIDFFSAPKSAKLPDRNAYIVTEIAWTIFSSTDLIVLSVFVSTLEASVYTIYNLVFSSLNTLLNAVYSSVNYLLGQSFHKNREEYLRIHDSFTSFFFGMMTVLMGTAYLLILPFVSIYTRGVSDVNYVIPNLPIMFCLVQMFSWSRYITGNLSGVAGYAKPTSYISLLEAIINISLSVFLVGRFGIVGVLLATVVALPIKVIYLTWLSEGRILKRNPIKYLLILAINFLYFAVIVFLGNRITLKMNGYFEFFWKGAGIFLLVLIGGMAVNILVNPSMIQVIYSLIKHNE